ncbi:hypothetical protein C9F11_20095 [Streptomyces sp. YIM 121038]|uniref:hypothetical protein n=1 Tax=Streptomyces sp. YIM 121038 TaxID=2136401 RepID=UPI001110A96A|nr:hypothetical protein [Streptomyces sp. YIM 121038]QCX77654.1 hypothetical protein C9F11_20095 [Streptomyces sp. YIM 121038]
MSPRPQQRAPKGRTRDRDDRRAVADILLARAQRGVLSPAEGALLAQHVRTEQHLADETRRAMAGTTRTLEQHREAADTAIVEAEQRADRAEQALAPVEQALAETRRRYRGAYDRVDQVLAVLARVRTAQSLGDALAAVAEHDGLSPAAARIHGRMLDHADTTDARLAEQQRDHDIALATIKERARRVRATMQRTVNHYREQAEANATRLDRIREMTDDWERRLPVTVRTATAADAVRRAVDGDDSPVMFDIPTANPATEAEHRAARYRLAWLAARRDRHADRAAMATELPLVQAVERVRALAARMRAGSPPGAAVYYAARIEQALANSNEQEHAA